MTLRNWLDNGWLVEHKTSLPEIADLLQVADRHLKDCETPGFSADWQLSIAYNSAVQTASAALAACGFRPGRDAHHHRVIQSLRFTIGADSDLINTFDQYRKKRNIGGYDMGGSVTVEPVACSKCPLGRSQRKPAKRVARIFGRFPFTHLDALSRLS